MPCAKCSLAEVQAAMKELQAIEARKSEIEAQKLQLYAELELEDEAEEELERQSVVKTWAQVQEEDFEQFSFSAVDAEGSEDDEEQNEEQEEEQVAKKRYKGNKGTDKEGSMYSMLTPLHQDADRHPEEAQGRQSPSHTRFCKE